MDCLDNKKTPLSRGVFTLVHLLAANPVVFKLQVSRLFDMNCFHICSGLIFAIKQTYGNSSWSTGPRFQLIRFRKK